MFTVLMHCSVLKKDEENKEARTQEVTETDLFVVYDQLKALLLWA